jgi:hypothetical protein
VADTVLIFQIIDGYDSPVAHTETLNTNRFPPIVGGELGLFVIIKIRFVDFAEYFVKRLSNAPIQIVATHFAQVANIADVVAFTIVLHILPLHLLSTEDGEAVEGFENGNAIATPTANIVNLPATWILIKCMNEAGHIIGVDIVSKLLTFVSINLV